MTWRGILAVGAVAALTLSAPDAAEAADGVSVESTPPRAVGYFVGDRLDYSGTISVPPGFALDAASTPRPRDLEYWLELDRVTIAPVERKEGSRYWVSLRYQTFYVPLEPRELRVPPVTIGFVRGEDGARLEATLPGFTFVSSPLRPILERSSPGAMRPDAPLAVIDTRPAQWRTGAAFGASLMLLGILAAYRGWLPAGRRRTRPLAEAARRVAWLNPAASRPAYRDALLALHRALDATFARRLLADDLELFLALRPRFVDVRGDLLRFFAASRFLHFAEDAEGAEAHFPAQELTVFAKRLASIERAP